MLKLFDYDYDLLLWLWSVSYTLWYDSSIQYTAVWFSMIADSMNNEDGIMYSWPSWIESTALFSITLACWFISIYSVVLAVSAVTLFTSHDPKAWVWVVSWLLLMAHVYVTLPSIVVHVTTRDFLFTTLPPQTVQVLLDQAIQGAVQNWKQLIWIRSQSQHTFVDCGHCRTKTFGSKTNQRPLCSVPVQPRL